jgi:hypothetical protein
VERVGPTKDGEQHVGSWPADASFNELVWAHFKRQGELDKGSLASQWDDEYRRQLMVFTSSHGDIVDSYWSPRDMSGVALTSGRKRPFRQRRPEYHRASEWRPEREMDADLARLLFRCDSLAIRSSELLSPLAARIALQHIFSVSTAVLAWQTAPRVEEGTEFIEEVTAQLDQIKAYVDRAAQARASWIFFVAMLTGLAGIAAVVVSIDLEEGPSGLSAAAAAILAGTLASAVSVLGRGRISSRTAPADVGQRAVVLLGLTRVALGAMFGAASYLVLAAVELLVDVPRELYPVAGFIAGFGERLVRVTDDREWDEVEFKPIEVAVKDTVEESIRTSLLGPRLVNWSGFVSVSIDDHPANGDRPVVSPGESLYLQVAFSPRPTGASFEREIDIRDGVDAPEVTFRVRADSDAVAAASEEGQVDLRADGEATIPLRLLGPKAPGNHQIWVRVTQLNRIVQMVPVDILVRDDN